MSDESDLMGRIYSLGNVLGVEMVWSPRLEVRVDLDSMNWDVRAAAVELVANYVAEQEHLVAADVRFAFPEPMDFTRATVGDALTTA